MDAATLYLVLTMTDGSRNTATFHYETVRDCEAHVIGDCGSARSTARSDLV